MTTTETLRRAAALMRERAQAATPGPWGFGGIGVATDYRDGRKELGIAVTDFTPAQFRDWPEDFDLQAELRRSRHNGEYIAAMPPAVALAVADWLDAEARASVDIGATLTYALAVATAYLNEEPSP